MVNICRVITQSVGVTVVLRGEPIQVTAIARKSDIDGTYVVDIFARNLAGKAAPVHVACEPYNKTFCHKTDLYKAVKDSVGCYEYNIVAACNEATAAYWAKVRKDKLV